MIVTSKDNLWEVNSYSNESLIDQFYDSGLLCTVTDHQQVRIYSLPDQVCIFETGLGRFYRRRFVYPSVAFSMNLGGLLICDGFALMLIDLRDGSSRRLFQSPWTDTGPVEDYGFRHVCVTSGGRKVLLTTGDHRLLVLDFDERRELWRKKCSYLDQAVALSRQGDYSAFVDDRILVLVENETGDSTQLEPPHVPEAIQELKFTYDDQGLLMKDLQGTTYLIDLETSDCESLLNDYGKPTFTGFDTNDGLLYYEQGARRLLWWSPQNRDFAPVENTDQDNLIQMIETTSHFHQAFPVWFSDTAGLKALGCLSSNSVIFDRAVYVSNQLRSFITFSGDQLLELSMDDLNHKDRSLKLPVKQGQCLATSKSAVLATARIVWVYDLVTFRERFTLDEIPSSPAIAISEAANLLFIGDSRDTIGLKAYRLSDGQLVATLPDVELGVDEIECDDEGEFVFYRDGANIIAWAIASRRIVFHVCNERKTPHANALCFGRVNGEPRLFATWERILEIRRADDGDSLQRLTLPAPGDFTGLRWESETQVLWAFSEQGQIIAIDISSNRFLFQGFVHVNAVKDLWPEPGGCWSQGEDGRLYHHQLGEQAPLETFLFHGFDVLRWRDGVFSATRDTPHVWTPKQHRERHNEVMKSLSEPLLIKPIDSIRVQATKDNHLSLKVREQLELLDQFEERYPKAMQGWTSSFYSVSNESMKGWFDHESLEIHFDVPEKALSAQNNFEQILLTYAQRGLSINEIWPLVANDEQIRCHISIIEVLAHECFHFYQVFAQKIPRYLNSAFQNIRQGRLLLIKTVVSEGLYWRKGVDTALSTPLRDHQLLPEVTALARYWPKHLETIETSYISYSGFNIVDLIEGQAFAFQKHYLESWSIETLSRQKNPCYVRALDWFQSQCDHPPQVFIIVVHLALREAFAADRRFQNFGEERLHPVEIFFRMTKFLASLQIPIHDQPPMSVSELEKPGVALLENIHPHVRQEAYSLLHLMNDLRRHVFGSPETRFNPWLNVEKEGDSSFRDLFKHAAQSQPAIHSDAFLVYLLVHRPAVNELCNLMLGLEDVEVMFYEERIPFWEVRSWETTLDCITDILVYDRLPPCCEKHDFKHTGKVSDFKEILYCDHEDGLPARFYRYTGRHLLDVIKERA